MARRRLLTQAQAEALVRYQPQLDQLKALLGQAQASYHTDVGVANTGRDAVQGSVTQVAPALHALTQSLGLGAANRGITLTHELSKLGGVADSIKGAALAEGTGAANRLASSDLYNMADLAHRYVGAAQGAEYSKSLARQNLRADSGKIATQINSVLGQKGAFTAATLESLTNAQLQRQLQDRISRRSTAATKRGQTLTHQDHTATLTETQKHDRALEAAANKKLAAAGKKAAQKANTGPLGPNTPKYTPKYHVKVQTVDAHATIRDGIDSAKTFAAKYKGQGVDRATVAGWLTQGRAEQTVDVKGKKVKVPGIPKAKSVLAASIALDLAYDGHISRRNAHELWRRGILLRGIGLKLAPRRSPGGVIIHNRRPTSVPAGPDPRGVFH